MRAEYSQAKSRWDGSFWFSVAQRLDELNIPYDIYVDYVFARHKPYPMPNHLTSAKMLDGFRELYTGDVGLDRANLVVDWCSQMAVAELRHRPLREVLTDPDLHFNPLFCYCLARNAGLDDIAGPLEPHASKFLRTYPRYRDTQLAAYIPKDL